MSGPLPPHLAALSLQEHFRKVRREKRGGSKARERVIISECIVKDYKTRVIPPMIVDALNYHAKAYVA